MLTQCIEAEKKKFAKINFKEFPLRKEEINAFRYRIEDVVSAISNK